MKYILLLLFFVHGLVYAQSPCPRWGSAKPGTLAYALNMKKNRTDIPGDYAKISITDFLKFKDDSVGDGEAIELTGGFVIDVRRQGPESCNCKSSIARDFHIVLVPDPADLGDKSKYVIVEITPRMQELYNWTDHEVFSLRNKYVDFYGYKFADLEHRNMSVQSNPTRTSCWRGTINEIHPVTRFVVRSHAD